MWHCSFPKKIYHKQQKERRMNEQSVEIRALVESIPEIRPLFAPAEAEKVCTRVIREKSRYYQK